MCTLLCLAPSTQRNGFELRPCCGIYHRLFLHSSVGRHLDSLQYLAVVNKLMRRFVHKYLCRHVVFFFLDKYLGIELLGHRVGLYLVF